MTELLPIRLLVFDRDANRRAALEGRVRGVLIELSESVDELRQAQGNHEASLLVADPCPEPQAVESLVSASMESGRQFVMVNPDRYHPSRRLIHEQLAAPLGKVGLVRIHRWEPPSDLEREFPDALLRDIDLALWLVGMRAARVFALRQGTGYWQVHLGFASGAMALLDYSSQLPVGRGYQSLSVIAANGAAYADDQQNMQLLYRGGHPRALRTDENAAHLGVAVQEFADALRAGRDLMTANEREWRHVFAVAQAVQKSLATCQAVAMEAP